MTRTTTGRGWMGTGRGLRGVTPGGHSRWAGHGVMALLLVVGGTALPANEVLAQERIDETRAFRPGGALEVRSVSHDIRLVPWDRDEVRVQGEFDPEREEFEIRGTEGSLTVEVRARGRGASGVRGRRSLEIQAPASLRLDLGSISGSLEGSGLGGTLGAGTVSGSIRLTGVDAQAVTASSVSGTVEVRGRAPEIRVRTVSGNAEVRAEASTLAVQSVSGRVTVDAASPLRRVELGAVSGRITFTGALAPGGDLEAESHSGGVELTLNPDVAARFRLSTFSGSVRSDLADMQDVREERSRFAPGETLTFTTGNGAGRVEARAFSGSVRVRPGGG
jgi:DUF4097 and DUF4098 domain-containing protein YvlB